MPVNVYFALDIVFSILWFKEMILHLYGWTYAPLDLEDTLKYDFFLQINFLQQLICHRLCKGDNHSYLCHQMLMNYFITHRIYII